MFEKGYSDEELKQLIKDEERARSYNPLRPRFAPTQNCARIEPTLSINRPRKVKSQKVEHSSKKTQNGPAMIETGLGAEQHPTLHTRSPSQIFRKVSAQFNDRKGPKSDMMQLTSMSLCSPACESRQLPA